MTDPAKVTTVKLGKLTLRGLPAVIAIVLMLGLVAALIIASRPSLGMLLSGGLWVAFMVYWGVTPQSTAPARRVESQTSRAHHQLLMQLGLLLLFVPVPGLMWRYLPERLHRVAIGLGVQCVFAVLYLWARSHLGRNWSSTVMVKTDHRLIRSGPYRLVRHPLYTAVLGMAAGTAIVSGALHALLGEAAFALAYWRKIALEEQALAAEFGAEYDAYRSHTWALIPWLL
ncbi:MAG: isoprenylcysteine carboxylmethyltransferase family protein [Planctomycetota bacterium]